jgi:hypothetical protein
VEHISQLLKIEKDKIKVLPKKECITLISRLVKYNDDGLKNWKIIASRLKYASLLDTNKIYLSILGGTIEWSKDYKSAFEMMCKRLPKIKKPKQQKLI